MRLSKHRSSGGIGFNMTPMIDIVFLLIIFFMTVSQITRVTDHPLPLPRVTEGDMAPVTATVTINLSEQGEIVIGGNRLSLPNTLTAVTNQLKKVNNDPDRIRIQIRCDRNCECGNVNRLLKQLANLGFQQVRAAVTDS
jgi:biopolymer transport protein ExbD